MSKSRLCTSTLAPMSMPRVGSSTISIFGRSASQRASTTFCWLPPERLPTTWSGLAMRMLSSLAVLLDQRVLLAASSMNTPRG